MRIRGPITLGTLVATLGLTASPALASVESVGVTDGKGGEVTANGGLRLRNLTPVLRLRLRAGSTQSYAVSVIGPAGAVAAQSDCSRLPDGLPIAYRGNGAYNVLVTSYTADGCVEQAGPVQTFSYTQAALVRLTAPADPVLLRAAGSTTVNPIAVTLRAAAGGVLEAQYAKNGNIKPGGGVLGDLQNATVDAGGERAQFLPRGPGTYVLSARQLADGFPTPWSTPVVMHVLAPFDLRKLTFPDTGGPIYQVRGWVREQAAVGASVTVDVARGRSGDAFTEPHVVTIRKDGSFLVRFRAANGGGRLRISFDGTGQVARGQAFRSFTVRGGRLRP